jgi:hypothetical protein
MAKQIENTGKAVAQLRLDFMNNADNQPSSPTDSDTTMDYPFYTHPSTCGPNKYKNKTAYTPRSAADRGHKRNFMPKMNFQNSVERTGFFYPPVHLYRCGAVSVYRSGINGIPLFTARIQIPNQNRLYKRYRGGIPRYK